MLILFLLVQGLDSFTLQGKVIDDQKQPTTVTLSLKAESTGNVLATTRSFANVTFRFEGLHYGDYVISINDSRYLLRDMHLSLHDMTTASQELTIPLVRNNAPPTAPSARDAYLDELRRLNLADVAGITTAAAFEEFKRGVDIAMLGSRRDQILVPASGKPEDDTAEMHFKKAVSLAPDFYEGYFELGLEQLRQSETANSVSTLEHAVTMNTTDPRPLRVLAELYIQQKQYQKTVDVLAKVGNLSSLNADDRYHLGVAFEGLGNAAAAQQQLQLAISLAPDRIPPAYLHLHNVDIQLNKVPEGIAVLEDFLRLFPNDPNRKVVEDRIKKLNDLVKKP